nr:hypothetical protein [Tanacetum cinerariifolium]
MASGKPQMKITRESQKYEAILCLTKPCELSDICNIWKHVCRKSIPMSDKFNVVDPDVNLSKIPNDMIENVSSGNAPNATTYFVD